MRERLAFILLLAVHSPASAAEPAWGHVSGTIVVEGELPQDEDYAKRFEDVCGDIVVRDDSLIAGQGGGLANAFVWLDEDPPEIHPDRAAEAQLPVRLTIEACRIQPHVATVRTGQALTFLNRDDLGHVPRVETFAGEAGESLLPAAGGAAAGRSVVRTFDEAERLPCPVRCSIYPWMSAYVLPLDHPYATTTDATGRFRIENLPAGERRFRVWHERTGWLDGGFLISDDTPSSSASGGRKSPESVGGSPGVQRVPFAADKGRFSLTIRSGENDLGAIRVPAAEFERK